MLFVDYYDDELTPLESKEKPDTFLSFHFFVQNNLKDTQYSLDVVNE